MRRLAGEGFAELLRHPIGRWIPDQVEVEKTPSPVIDPEPHVEEREANRRYDMASPIAEAFGPAVFPKRCRALGTAFR